MNLGDGGGLTRFGVAQESHPEVPESFYTCPPLIALQQAELIYEGQYWDRFMGDEIIDDGVASELLSFGINDGLSREVKMLQACLGVTVDGVMGPDTLAHTNAANGPQLAAALRAYQAQFYRDVVVAHPEDASYLDGWLRRAARVFPNLTP